MIIIGVGLIWLLAVCVALAVVPKKNLGTAIFAVSLGLFLGIAALAGVMVGLIIYDEKFGPTITISPPKAIVSQSGQLSERNIQFPNTISFWSQELTTTPLLRANDVIAIDSSSLSPVKDTLIIYEYGVWSGNQYRPGRMFQLIDRTGGKAVSVFYFYFDQLVKIEEKATIQIQIVEVAGAFALHQTVYGIPEGDNLVVRDFYKVRVVGRTLAFAPSSFLVASLHGRKGKNYLKIKIVKILMQDPPIYRGVLH